MNEKVVNLLLHESLSYLNNEAMNTIKSNYIKQNRKPKPFLQENKSLETIPERLVPLKNHEDARMRRFEHYANILTQKSWDDSKSTHEDTRLPVQVQSNSTRVSRSGGRGVGRGGVGSGVSGSVSSVDDGTGWNKGKGDSGDHFKVCEEFTEDAKEFFSLMIRRM